MKPKDLGWYIASGLVLICALIGLYAIKLDAKNEQLTKELQSKTQLVNNYRERVALADSSIIIFDGHLANALRNKGLTADEAADLLDAMVYSWQTSKK